jgi:hypothetical protein
VRDAHGRVPATSADYRRGGAGDPPEHVVRRGTPMTAPSALGGRPRTTLRVSLPTPVRRAAEARAVACGLDVGRWIGEVVEAHLAGERCGHAGPPPEAPASAAAPTPVVSPGPSDGPEPRACRGSPDGQTARPAGTAPAH